MNEGDAITVGSIRAALLLLAATWGVQLVSAAPRVDRAARWLWTIGCVCLWLHIAAAFHFHHHWSHAEAWEATARRTREQLGVAVGAGLYLNYLFGAVWLAEVAAWWAMPERFARRPAWAAAGARAFMLFIAVQATIVFETGGTRWTSLAVCLALAGLAFHRWRRGPRGSVT